MDDLKLIEPSNLYKETFIRYAQSYINEPHYYLKYKKSITDFDAYLNDLSNQSNGVNLPIGYIPTNTYWLIHNEEVVGVIRIRHEMDEYAGHIGYDISPIYRNKGYGTHLLKLGIKQAKLTGLKNIMVTCNVENNASKRVIEKNNGTFIDCIYDPIDLEYVNRYIFQ